MRYFFSFESYALFLLQNETLGTQNVQSQPTQTKLTGNLVLTTELKT